MTDFPPLLPHGTVEEILPDIYWVRGQIQIDAAGTMISCSRNMTVLREGDILTLVNSIRLDDASLQRLDELGRVENVVRLGSFHGRDDAFYLDRYDAQFWAMPGMDFSRGETIDQMLQDGKAGPGADTTVFAFENKTFPEAILHLNRHGGLLVTCDSLQNILGPDEFFNDAGVSMMEAAGFFAPANIGPGWRKRSDPKASEFARLQALTFDHLLSAHGDPLLGDAQAAVSATLADRFGI